MDKIERWSGFDKQSLPWQRGYEWAHSRGDHAELGCIEAAEAWGYDFCSDEDEEFGRGIEFAQHEQQEG